MTAKASADKAMSSTHVARWEAAVSPALLFNSARWGSASSSSALVMELLVAEREAAQLQAVALGALEEAQLQAQVAEAARLLGAALAEAQVSEVAHLQAVTLAETAERADAMHRVVMGVATEISASSAPRICGVAFTEQVANRAAQAFLVNSGNAKACVTGPIVRVGAATMACVCLEPARASAA